MLYKYVSGKQGESIKFSPDEATKSYALAKLIIESVPDRFELKACIYAICGEYKKRMTMLPQKRQGQDLPHAILQYIEENFKENITLRSAAQHLQYDYSYLSRLYHSVFNLNIKELVNQHRVEDAKRLILEGEKSLSEIALECGFQSIRSFNRVFAEQAGCAPRGYGGG